MTEFDNVVSAWSFPIFSNHRGVRDTRASLHNSLQRRMISTAQEAEPSQKLPVLTSVLLVTRACLPSPDEAVQSGIAEHLNGLLDTFSSRFSVRRACRKKNLSRRALEYLAGRDPDWGHGSKIAENAVVDGLLRYPVGGRMLS